jgi:hypothetical protein
MSEFKFACPVCGQHITADSSGSGGQLECPTCFQKIVVPQAPASAGSKFILSASQVTKPRSSRFRGPEQLELIPEPPGRKLAISIAAIVLVLAAGAATATLLLLGGRAVHRSLARVSSTVPPTSNLEKDPKPGAGAETPGPARTNVLWALALTNVDFPEAVAGGCVHGDGFLCERATLQGGNLTLRQGKTGASESSVTVSLFAQQGEELSDKVVQIDAERTPPLPRITLRWRRDEKQSTTEHFNSGYSLKLSFGSAANGRMPGRIYLCLPDDSKSVVAGTFDAEIRKQEPRRPRPAP